MNSEPLKLALALLTRLPVSVHTPVQPRDQGLAVPCYPLVGLLIGALLATLAAALHSAPAWPLAALLVIAWVGLTGALHLDGLADSADAWLGGYGDRQRTLQIMKDPACGPAGVVALVLVLLGKVAALATLLASGQWLSLLLAPVLGRSACAALFVILPYQRDNGLAGDAARHLPRRATLLAGLAGLLLALVCGQLLMALVSVLLLAGGAALMRQRLGGFTGDTAGALVEGVEMASLLAAALLL
ncbi:cobalamin 5'-phosphate synthase [Alcanivorax hongdengensis A-11-3]|uniref:Adenosylcobinamide-GDP ribazoletransferase n=1 Tax=Alcanivorax hongdengensis A-11-3 TaxID=1177179 RepID=L0WF95_9GAMM|nr:adenosylcobinamide-GDP ribazoletransferase [Alcanivorax hongdengensis]EKF75513.1 cobalamin 5'-phosphate synthase [Alcanivorax hongdengensis A-11-3]